MTPTQPKRSAWTTVACVTVLLTSYVLSVGPAYRAVKLGHLADRTFIVLYLPLLWLIDSSNEIHRLFRWYVQLFSP